MPGVVSRAVSACTAIIEMWCATTSCSSRAIRARSPRAVCSSRVPAMTSLAALLLGGLAAGPPGDPGQRRRRGQRGQHHGQDRGLRHPPGSASASTRNGAASTTASGCAPLRPSRYKTISTRDRTGHGQQLEQGEREHARPRSPPRPRPAGAQEGQRQRGDQAQRTSTRMDWRLALVAAVPARCPPTAAVSETCARPISSATASTPSTAPATAGARGRGDPLDLAGPLPRSAHVCHCRRWPVAWRHPGQESGYPSRGGWPGPGVPRGSARQDGSPA